MLHYPRRLPPWDANRGPQPGSTKVNAKDHQKYGWIPPGSSIMGCCAGVAWGYDPRAVRVSVRVKYEPGIRLNNVGFRRVGE
jgi:formylglycine-generating enzyme required for sulfatase activity